MWNPMAPDRRNDGPPPPKEPSRGPPAVRRTTPATPLEMWRAAPTSLEMPAGKAMAREPVPLNVVSGAPVAERRTTSASSPPDALSVLPAATIFPSGWTRTS